MRIRKVFQTDIAGLPITLEQRGVNSFRVTYWKQGTDRLTYSQACTELGASIMHALAANADIRT